MFLQHNIQFNESNVDTDTSQQLRATLKLK